MESPGSHAHSPVDASGTAAAGGTADMDSALIAELDDVHVLVDAELLSAAAADARSGDHAPSHDNLVMQLAVLQADNRHLVHALAAKEQSQRMLIQYVVTVSVVSGVVASPALCMAA